MGALYTDALPNAVDAAVGAAAALADGITPAVPNCQEVLIRADINNTNDILLGNADAQTFPLHKDEIISIKTHDITSIWRKAQAGTQKLYWWARSNVSER